MYKTFIHILIIGCISLVACNNPINTEVTTVNKLLNGHIQSLGLDQVELVKAADRYMDESPVTITSHRAERSAGGLHDYYSEGSYWWPNENDPAGPYIRKDGNRNPNNFKLHKIVLRDFSIMVTTLVGAYEITKDEKYARQAMQHITAWFVDPATKMNASLLYAQAIKGINTGRGIGIIDTITLIDIAISIEYLQNKNLLQGADLAHVKAWFEEFAVWLTTHPYGIAERDNNNNHSTWWGAQVAAYASVADRPDIVAMSQAQYKKQLDIQMAADGSFPEELSRTKPFHYMNYNLRAWTAFALLASTDTENLWDYESKNGSIKKALEYAIPFYNKPSSWTHNTAIEQEIHPEPNDFLVYTYWGIGDINSLNTWNELMDTHPKAGATKAHLILWNHKYDVL